MTGSSSARTNIVPYVCRPDCPLPMTPCVKRDGAPLGHKVSGGPMPMYGHCLDLNEQWVSLLEKVGTILTCFVNAYSSNPCCCLTVAPGLLRIIQFPVLLTENHQTKPNVGRIWLY